MGRTVLQNNYKVLHHQNSMPSRIHPVPVERKFTRKECDLKRIRILRIITQMLLRMSREMPVQSSRDRADFAQFKRRLKKLTSELKHILFGSAPIERKFTRRVCDLKRVRILRLASLMLVLMQRETPVQSSEDRAEIAQFRRRLNRLVSELKSILHVKRLE